ncbi:Conserved hypothetical protein CHP02453 [Desulfovibrio sp. X2]|uniref:DUF2461 domain-containing protein n=1 Tax=Desulfovibrio sp. X2 TaxID=941449 RepID=UPI0003588CBD|nr:DUF2461 domain-containing protein [Desulfovibrio sp. X2]EPR37507.1 Conserved hypothetical protein CHP02453 [Desulfovibrio sp. X2]
MPTAPAFPPALFAFFRELRTNNARPWFQANKTRYERDVLAPCLAFVQAMTAPLARVSPWLAADARVGGTLFRIYRDVRFSADKSPYKLHAGLWFYHRTAGRSSDAPGFYVHLEPDGVLLALGSYQPRPPALAAIRQAVADDPDAWFAARDRAARVPWSLAGEVLKRTPKGFSPDHPAAADIKRKDFYVVAPLSEDEACAPDFLEQCLALGEKAKPLGGFLASALNLPW